MKKYCQIQDGICWWIFESDTPPEFAPDIVIKDISAEKYNDVREGWVWDEPQDMFYPPIIPDQPEATPTLDTPAIMNDILIEMKYQTLLTEMLVNS